MTKPFTPRPLQFFLTAPAPCPYLPGRRERKVFAHLNTADGAALNDALTHAGFRRSQAVIYRPACDACESCLSARVAVQDFEPTRSQRRVLRRNADLVHVEREPVATPEQFDLLSRYLDARHARGGMAGMSFGDYAMMVTDTPALTTLATYRRATDDRLLAVALVDRLSDGHSLVYSFFDPAEARRSLGTFMIADQIRRGAAAGLSYVYLGYWVSNSAKMDYKAQFRPLEVLMRGGWRRVRVERPGRDA